MSGLEGLLTGRTLVKRYRIQEVIGRGGFAAVYRADDERLGRPVAVKVITLAASDEEAREHLRERFQREARAAASLPQHPNVVTVHDFGTDPELGLDFLVMELLHGEDLATHLARQRKLPLDSAVRILRDGVEGVAVGHRANLMHRDVKPGNIFLAEPHGEDPFRVCVLDFGIARVATHDQDTRLTKTGIPLSPAYASPEQLRGERDLTCASDVFSLGVVAYQLLTGEKPLRADRTTDPADWTPDRTIRELNPEIPPAVEAIVTRAMSYDPGARYPDAATMARALDEAMAGGNERTVIAPVPTPAVVAAAPLEDERTLLQAEPTPPPAAPARPATVAPTPEAQRRPAFATWGIGLLIAAVITVAGLWALSRGGGPDEGPARDIVIEEPEVTNQRPTTSGPRVTGEIMESPSGGVVGVDPIGRSGTPDVGGTDAGGGRPGVYLPPAVSPSRPQPPTQQPQSGGGLPGQTIPPQGATPQPSVPPAAQPQPQLPQQPQPQPADTSSGPKLLGVPVDRSPQPADTAGGGGSLPSLPLQ